MLARMRIGLALLVTVAVLAGVVFLATRADGREATRATSNDGGAWMADRTQGGIAHIEFETREPSVTLIVEKEGGARLSVRQSDRLTLVHDASSSIVSVIDTAIASRRSDTGVPLGSVVRPMERAIAIHDPGGQRLWVTHPAEFGQVEALEELDPLALRSAHLAVGRSGLAASIGPDMRVTWIDDEDGLVESGALPIGSSAEHVTMSGDVLIVVTESGWHSVQQETGSRSLSSVDAPSIAAIQQESPLASSVGFFATDGSLAIANVWSGDVAVLGSMPGMSPLGRPILHGGCLYALGVSSNAVAAEAVCEDGRAASEINGDAPQLSRDAELRLVNGRVFIDERDGSGWVYSADLILEEIESFSAAFDETEDREDETSDEIEERIDQNSVDAELTEADKRQEEENVAPVAEDDTDATRLGRPVVVDVLANDVDDNGDVLLVDQVELVEGAARLEIANDGTGVQVTELGGPGLIKFRYRVTDGRGPDSTDTATVTVNVLPAVETDNNPPEARVDRLTGAAGTVLTVNLTNNDEDPDGDSIVLTEVDGGTDVRVLSIHPDGDALVVLPSTVIEGVIKVPYLIRDEWGMPAEGELQVTVRLDESNVPPDARNDSAVAQVGQRIVVDLLANDVDGDGDVLSTAPARLVNVADVGFYSTSLDGEFTFEPKSVGTFLFEYEATDRRASDTAQIRVEVRDSTQNRPPVALRDDVVLALGETRLVRSLVNDGDPDGDLVGIVDISPNEHLDIELKQGVGFLVTMKSGADTVEAFTYRVSDGTMTSEPTSVVVARSDVAFQDAPPVAVEDSLRVRAGRRSGLKVLRNDFDPEGGSLVITALDVSDPEIAVEIGALGQWFEVAVPDERVLPFNVVYTVTDEAGNSDAGTVELAIVPEEEKNTPPTARPDEAYTIEGTGIAIPVLANDTDPESDAILLLDVIREAPQGGSVELAEDLISFVYRPNAGFVGTDRFSYVVQDSEGDESIGIVRVAVMPEPQVNNPPVANPDNEFEFVANGQEVPLAVLENDFDLDGDVLTVIEVRGSASARNIGEGIVLALPERAVETETVALVYSISDGRGGTDETEVTVTILPNVDAIAPIAEDDRPEPVKSGDIVRVSVLDNDEDPDGLVEDLVVSLADDVEHAALDAADPQVVVVTAPEESVQIEYTITDVDGLSDTAVIELTVEPNLAPEVRSPFLGEFFTDEPIPTIDLSNYVEDPEGDELEFFNLSAQVGGITIQDRDASDARIVDFEPEIEFEGEAGFAFSVRDAAGNEASGRVTMTLLGKSNEAPVGTDQSIQIEAGVPQPFDLTSMFEDPDEADVLVVEVIVAPNEPLTLSDLGDGRVELAAPITADAAALSLRARATDPEGEVAEAQLDVELLISSIGPPVATEDTAETNQEVAIDVNVLANDVDTLGQGDLKIISTFVDATAGTTSHSVDTISFVPEASFFGTATIQYRIADARDRVEGEADGLLIVEVIGRPDAPAGLDVSSAGPKDVTLTWQVPANNGAPIEGYRIRITNDEGLPEEMIDSLGNSPSYRFSDRTPGVEYRFEVLAFNQAGDGFYSPMSSPIKPDAVAPPPGKPEVRFSETPGELLVSWAEPPPGDYSAIARYFLEIGGCTSETVDVGLVTEWAWSGLVNGERCTFRSYAENEKVADGASPLWSPQSDPECPVEVPAAPAAPTVERGDKQATITWNQPVSLDCEEIIGYEVQRFRNGVLDGDPRRVAFGTLEQLFGGLQNGDTYTFDVRAENRQGWGARSAVSAPVVPCGVPEAPPAMTAARGDTLATLTSNGPAPANGCVVSQYQVEVTPSGRIDSHAGDFASGSATGLTNGTSYSFRLRGVNEIGVGDWSAVSNVVTPAGNPIGGTISIATQSNIYRWTINGADGNGTNILSYTLTGDITGYSTSAASGTGECRNQQNNPCEAPNGSVEKKDSCDQQQQTVAVSGYATNNVGNGMTLNLSQSLDGCPNAPSLTSLTSSLTSTTSGSYEVRWSRPAGTDHIYIQEGSESASSWDGPRGGTSRTYSASPGETVAIRVWACNEFGCRSSGQQSVTVPNPRVTATWGSEVPDSRLPTGTCDVGDGCRYINYSWSDFPSGSHAVDCGNSSGVWWTESRRANGSSGSGTTGCVIQPGYLAPIWIEIGGVRDNVGW